MLIAAFLTGFLGSFHCIGMCSPIALALPFQAQNRWKFVLSRLFYNFGRIFTYAFLGILVGIVGRSIGLFTTQQWLSLAMGLLILLFLSLPKNYTYRFQFLRFFQPVRIFLKNKFALLFKQKSFLGTFIIGVLNGFLPCGLVYLALAGASVMGNILESSLYMALFGLGTLPMMLGISLVGNFIKPNLRKQVYKFVPVFAFALAFWLIIRGLNLGIPYLSPKVEQGKIECCTPEKD